MTDLSQVTYCGLYCGLCSQRNRIPQRARALRDAMSEVQWDKWGAEIPRFKEFWEYLGGVADSEGRCSCREGSGPPSCGMRKCAQKRGVEVCAFCNDYPCRRIEGMAKGYAMMLADAKRMREIGLDAWIAEQEERRKTGFAYEDILCHPFEVAQD